MRTSVRAWLMVAAPVAGIVFVAVAWQSASVGASRPPKVITQTVTQTQVVQDTTGIDQLRAQVAALQQAVSATSQSAAAANQAATAASQSAGSQLSTLGTQISGVQHSVASLQTAVSQAQSAAGASSAQVKDLGVSLTAVTQELSALQAQFVAEVKKLQAKGIG